MVAAKLMVRVVPRAGRNAVSLAGDGAIRVHVTAPPEGGKANAAVVEVLGKRLGVGKTRVRIAAGARARDKTIVVDGLSEDQALAALRLC